MNGWLSKDGIFTECDFMQHDKVAWEQFHLTEHGMYREGFVKIFTAFGYTDISHSFFLSDKQKQWLKKNKIEY